MGNTAILVLDDNREDHPHTASALKRHPLPATLFEPDRQERLIAERGPA